MALMQESGCSVVDLDSADVVRMIDVLARRRMGISGAEFQQRAAAGEYDQVDWDAVPGLVDVAIAAGISA